MHNDVRVQRLLDRHGRYYQPQSATRLGRPRRRRRTATVIARVQSLVGHEHWMVVRYERPPAPQRGPQSAAGARPRRPGRPSPPVRPLATR